MSVAGTIGIHRRHLEAGDMPALPVPADPATVRAVAHQQQGTVGQTPRQAVQGAGNIHGAGKAQGFDTVAGPDIDTRQQGRHGCRVRRVDQRPRIEHHRHFPRQGQHPVQQRLHLVRVLQAVAADIDIVVGLHRNPRQIGGREPAFGADMGNEGALGTGFGQGDAEPGVLFLVAVEGDLDPFRHHRLTGQFAEAAVAVTTEVDHRQAIAPGGGHHIETGTGFEAGGIGQGVTATDRQLVEGNDQVNHDLAGMQQSSHWHSLQRPHDDPPRRRAGRRYRLPRGR